MFDFIDLSWMYGNGWVGVICGIVLFGLGWYKGLSGNRHFAEHLIESVIDDLAKQGYIKTQRKYNEETGVWEVDLLKYDE